MSSLRIVGGGVRYRGRGDVVCACGSELESDLVGEGPCIKSSWHLGKDEQT